MPRVTETSHISHRWIRSDHDVNIETLSKPNNLIESRPPVIPVQHRAPSIPSRLDHEMNIGLFNKRTLNPKFRFFILLAKVQLITLDHQMPTNRTRPSSTNEQTRRENSLPKSNRSITSAKAQRSPTKTTYRCTNCNRMYDDKRNYDIHKLYCRT